MQKIDNIKNLWQELEHGTKTDFINECAKDLKKSPLTLHNHWFARFWQVPEKHQDRVIKLLQNYINSNQRVSQ